MLDSILRMWFEKWFVRYVPIIGTGSEDLQVVVCHFANWFGSEDDNLPSHGTIQHAVDQSEHSALMWETVKPCLLYTSPSPRDS